MNCRKTALALLAGAIATLLIAGTALAGSIDFTFRGNLSNSQAAWGGGTSTVNASANHVGVGSSTGLLPLGDALISFSSGPGTGGSGSVSNPYTFGTSLDGSITITGCLPGQGAGCSPVTLFTGQFQTGETAFWSAGKGHFDGTDVTGTLNPQLAADYGLSSDNVTGELMAFVMCNLGPGDKCEPGVDRMLAGGNLFLTPAGGGIPPVPEPSALFLLGSGLCGVVLVLRRRRKA